MKKIKAPEVMQKDAKTPEPRKVKTSDGKGLTLSEKKSVMAKAAKKSKDKSEAMAVLSIPTIVKAAKKIGVELGLKNLPDGMAIDLVNVFLEVPPEKRYEVFQLILDRHIEDASEKLQSLSTRKKQVPGCCMRNGKGNKRSTDLDPAVAPNPEQMIANKMAAEILEIASDQNDDFATEKKQEICPNCSHRRATPLVDDYARMNGDKKAVEGSRSEDLDPLAAPNPEQILLRKESRRR